MTSADAAFRDWTAQCLTQVEAALSDWVPLSAPAGLGEAMRYAVLDGGKRLRPLPWPVRSMCLRPCARPVRSS